MELQEAYCVLKHQYGNHVAAARTLGLSPEHYRAIRNGRVPVPKRTADLIILKAQEVTAFDNGIARSREAVSV